MAAGNEISSSVAQAKCLLKEWPGKQLGASCGVPRTQGEQERLSRERQEYGLRAAHWCESVAEIVTKWIQIEQTAWAQHANWSLDLFFAEKPSAESQELRERIDGVHQRIAKVFQDVSDAWERSGAEYVVWKNHAEAEWDRLAMPLKQRERRRNGLGVCQYFRNVPVKMLVQPREFLIDAPDSLFAAVQELAKSPAPLVVGDRLSNLAIRRLRGMHSLLARMTHRIKKGHQACLIDRAVLDTLETDLAKLEADLSHGDAAQAAEPYMVLAQVCYAFNCERTPWLLHSISPGDGVVAAWSGSGRNTQDETIGLYLQGAFAMPTTGGDVATKIREALEIVTACFEHQVGAGPEQPEPPSDADENVVLGVPLRVIAEILQNSDEERVVETLARWNKSRRRKPTPVGWNPTDRRQWLYEPTAIVAW
ncbi:MAG: hypothetical protein GWP08_19835, partial [Nitrospiraceae bacterium]|nr:hypothetical protein [Nitrospiraceae bacterium]